MKVKPKKLKAKNRMEYLDILYTGLAGLKTREEMKNFLKDLLTESERIMIGRRIKIAQELLRDKSYMEIVKDMKVGIDTVMRVDRWLQEKGNNYEKTIRRMEKAFISRGKMVDYYPSGTFARLRKRYPLHFLLFNLFKEFNKE